MSAWRPLLNYESGGMAIFRATPNLAQMALLAVKQHQSLITCQFSTNFYSLNKEDIFILLMNYPILNQMKEGISIIHLEKNKS